jgi:hypothetical protein
VGGIKIQAGIAGGGIKNKLPTLSKKDKANGKKIKQVARKGKFCYQKKISSRLFVITKALRKSVGGFPQEYWISKTG